MTDCFENENGNIVIILEVIARFTDHAGLDFFGIIGMTRCSVKDGVEKLLGG